MSVAVRRQKSEPLPKLRHTVKAAERPPVNVSRNPTDPRVFQDGLWSAGQGLRKSRSAPNIIKPQGHNSMPIRLDHGAGAARRTWALHSLRRPEYFEDPVIPPVSLRGLPGYLVKLRREQKAEEEAADYEDSFYVTQPASTSSSSLPAAVAAGATGAAGPLLSPKQPAPLYQPRYVSAKPNPFTLIKGSRLSSLILQGAIAVVKSSYFEDCEMRGLPFGRRQDISSMFIWPGPQAVQQWAKHGKCFLCNVSYGWLSKSHPDPDGYHLKRLVRIFNEFKALWEMQEVGVIIDFCSIWQPDGDKDNRAEEQIKLHQQSLEEICTPFGHRGVTSFILTGTPPEEPRLYHDRGWTLLETTMIDLKGGDWNRWKFGNFDTHGTWANPYAFFSEARLDGRKVPPRPEDFEDALDIRRAGTEAKGCCLFSRSVDEQRVPKLFRMAFKSMTCETKLVYDGVGWTDDDMHLLADLLPHYEDLEQLHLRNNKIGTAGAGRLAEVIPSLKRLQCLVLTGNPLSRNFTVQAYLSHVWCRAGKPLRLLEF
eukprot:TRINITY_DN112900_c0_g1_i1.p1 TRINITY_DN112900_c0_g1~~TRINITY_DN112900_c0_g1_i1.p1  ORF type:complete len:537 (+),score=133.92 TRINITY_DN112900_c0_g1_i1:63-1673(+)